MRFHQNEENDIKRHLSIDDSRFDLFRMIERQRELGGAIVRGLYFTVGTYKVG